MLSNLIQPVILDCGYVKLISNSNKLSPKRIVRDYEIDYNISGGRVMILDGKRYEIKPNSIIFKYPGQVVQSTENFDMYTLTLRLSGNKKPQKNIRKIDGEIQSTEKSDFFSSLMPCFSPMHYSEILNDYAKIIKTYSTPEQNRECRDALDHMLYLLFADAITERQVKRNRSSTNVEAAIGYMEKNYQNSQLSLSDIAKAVNISDSYFARLFKQETSYTPKHYLNNIRLRQAKWYVTYTSDSINTISYLCGFDNPQYFISKFKAKYGTTPQAYRQKNKITKQQVE